MGDTSVKISPSGWRTATHIFCGPRIITPSIRACPPTLVLKQQAFSFLLFNRISFLRTMHQ
jgi:hypothetical protein